MDQLRTFLDRFGAPGATRNAELAVQARRDEERLVASLADRLQGSAAQAA